MTTLYRCPFCNTINVSAHAGADVFCCGEQGRATPVDGPFTAADFYTLLAQHDWYYQHSDDQRDWKRGAAEHAALCEIARLQPEHSATLAAYTKHKFEGGPKPADPRLLEAA